MADPVVVNGDPAGSTVFEERNFQPTAQAGLNDVPVDAPGVRPQGRLKRHDKSERSDRFANTITPRTWVTELKREGLYRA
jgi:hypothetical protein